MRKRPEFRRHPKSAKTTRADRRAPTGSSDLYRTGLHVSMKHFRISLCFIPATVIKLLAAYWEDVSGRFVMDND
jgi:hypothetical protein